MNKHVPFRKDMRRDEIVDCMAAHLVAAILHDGLDTSSDIDVIQTLLNLPERFNHRVVLNHMDSALYEAKQVLIQREMERSEEE